MVIDDVIMDIVTEAQGMKATELVVEVARQLHGAGLKQEDIPAAFERLVIQNKLVECEYVLPSMDYRLKSFYMPAGTKATIR